jgi:hypothetical protein
MKGRRFIVSACAAAAFALAATRASADPATPTVDRDVADSTPPVAPLPAVEQAASEGQLLPFTLTPRVGSAFAVVAGYGGYDSARGAVMESHAEVRVFGPVALRVGTELGDTSGQVRPSVGARLQFLSERRHGVDGAVSVSYRAEGFTEAEGEIETVLAFGRAFGRALVVGNVAYGQDPEGRERDGEARVAVLGAIARRLRLGVDGRWRFDLGSDTAKLRASNEPTTDLDVGPVVAVSLGPVALTGHAGASLVRRVDGVTRMGAVALAGLGTAF